LFFDKLLFFISTNIIWPAFDDKFDQRSIYAG